MVSPVRINQETAELLLMQSVTLESELILSHQKGRFLCCQKAGFCVVKRQVSELS